MFQKLTVCRVKDWEEVRLPGKFIRVTDNDDDSYEAVLSKWYYQVEVANKPQRIVVTLHQEDERRRGVVLRRPYCDVSLVILRLQNESVELYDIKDFVVDRQIEIEVSLDRGTYIILPRTTGCMCLRVPEKDDYEPIPLFIPVDEKVKMHPKTTTVPTNAQLPDGPQIKLSLVFESTIEEIFAKFDIDQSGVLTYPEFRAFCDTVGRRCKPEMFSEFLRLNTSTQYSKDGALAKSLKRRSDTVMSQSSGPSTVPTVSSEGLPLGLTLDGFKQWMLSEIVSKKMQTGDMFTWLENLGYGTEIYQLRSRAFTMSIHSRSPLEIEMKEALLTDLDFRTNQLIIEQYGQM